MAEHSLIEWTDATWNPITGCSVVSPGCTNCYAMRLAGTRLRHHPSRAGLTIDSKAGPVWNGHVRFNAEWLDQPLKWKRPRMIFVCAHGDLFHESVPDEWIDLVFAVMAHAPQHTFQVLTKRAERMKRYFSDRERREHQILSALQRAGKLVMEQVRWPHLPLHNVWLGVSVEDQRRADERIPHLLATPAAVRFLSCEPLLGPIDFYKTGLSMPEERNIWRGSLILFGINWVIVGGESGPGARPMHPEWVRSLRDQCVSDGVAFFFKQWGEWMPSTYLSDEQRERYYVPTQDPSAPVKTLVEATILCHDGTRMDFRPPWNFPAGSLPMPMFAVGKKAAGRLLDGVEHNARPDTEMEAA